MEVLLGAAWIVVWLLLATTAASMAKDRGLSPVLWFVLGLFFPILALIVLSIAFDRLGAGTPGQITLADAVRRNPVVRALGRRPRSSAHQLAEATSMPLEVVAGDLHRLRRLGLADRDASGRWSLSDEAIRLSPGPRITGVSGPGDVTPSP